MNKKMMSLALAIALALSLSPAAFAAGSFTDVRDAETARNVEVLRLMGVVGGDRNGDFRPGSNLTRAEFCKMAIELLGDGGEILRYRSRTIFPDVRATHWAAGYINYAANYTLASGGEQGSARLIRGLPDGTFAPNRDITFGEAVTILMRILGYSDEMSGGIWPRGYIDLAAANGVVQGVNLSGGAAITRAQAAQLFVNALGAKTASGADFLGNKSELTTLLWIDAGTGKMRTTDGSYSMARPKTSTALTGSRGYVLFDDEKRALTFLPLTNAGGGVTNAALVVGMDGSVEGFDALTGGSVDCVIYKNGAEISPSDVKKNDVATYSAMGNSIQLCDTRVTVYYENCSPSPRTPATITVLGGTTLNVVPTAQQSLSRFKPGDTMTLLLTANGDVAGAIEPGGQRRAEANAVGVVGSDGKVRMLCGSGLIPLSDEVSADDLPGRAVSIEQIGRNRSDVDNAQRWELKLKELKPTVLYGALDPVTRTIGTIKLSNSVMIFDQGEPVTLRTIVNGGTTTDRVTYAHLNSLGEYDLIILGTPTAGDVYYGRIERVVERPDQIEIEGDDLPEGMELPDITLWYIQIASGNGELSPEARCFTEMQEGLFVEAVYGKNGTEYAYTTVRSLAQIRDVEPSAWIGTRAVVVDGHTYSVAENIPCYNRDTGLWMNDDIEAALAYAKTVNLYLSSNVVRVIEVAG